MKVLLATDGSANATEAAKFLSRLPHREPLELTVVTTIVYPNLHPADAVTTWPPELWDQLNETARHAVDEIPPLFDGADVTLNQEIVEGHAGETIVDKASAIGADLIVLGAKGHSAIERILLGSVSDYVANHAHCGVIVIRPPTEPAGESRFCTTIAYDGSPAAEVAIDQFTQFGWGTTTETQVLSIVPVVRFFGRNVLPDKLTQRTEQHEIASDIAANAVKRLEATETDATAHVIEAEHIGDKIVHFAQEHGSDLIVVGATGLGGITRMLLGSVSRYVLRHAGCSVWIAR